MSTTAAELSNPLPSAKQAMEKLAVAEAEKARSGKMLIAASVMNSGSG